VEARYSSGVSWTRRAGGVVKLPGCDKAVIPNEKVRDYLLSDEHPVARFKAAFFHALGYTRPNWDQLRCDLLVHASEGQAKG